MRKLICICNRLAAAAVLLLAGASSLLAVNRIEVIPGIHGGTCGVGNPNTSRYGGNCGAKITIDSGGSPGAVYVQDNTPSSEGTYRVRFYVNMTGFTLGGPIDVFAAYDGNDPAAGSPAGTAIVRAVVQGTSPRQLVVVTQLDSGTQQTTAVNLADGWRAIEIEWARATSAGANNGGLNLWVDGFPQTGLASLDNDTRTINVVRWGAVAGLSAGSSGPFLMDEFVSQRTGAIGLAPFSGDARPADFNDDGRSDVVIYRNGTWIDFPFWPNG